MHPSLSTLALALGALALEPGAGQPLRLDKRDDSYTRLADGNYFQSGTISSTLQWQASGILDSGSCPSIGIVDCYRLMLNSDGNLQSTKKPSGPISLGGGILRRRASAVNDHSTPRTTLTEGDYFARATSDDDDLEDYFALLSPTNNSTHEIGHRRLAAGCPAPPPHSSPSPTGASGGGVPLPTKSPRPPKQPSPRQRIEIFSWPGADSGERFTYSWKSRMLATSSTRHFFHTFQVLSRDVCTGKGAPVITLDLFEDSMVIDDNALKCPSCVTSPLSDWFNRTIAHEMTVTYGLGGSIDYAATPLDGGPALLVYQSSNRDMGDQGSVKFGSYRAMAAGLEPVVDFVGDYSAVKH